MAKTYAEINKRIKEGNAVVFTAEEIIGYVEEHGLKKAAKKVDVVTTATFGPMCSSGAFLNTGHTTPRLKMQSATLNGVEAYAGLAAVDIYIGATQMREGDALNTPYPGKFEYGGAHVIQDLVDGKAVHLEARAYGTDCYPSGKADTWLKLEDLNEAFLFNPRNAYQNYNVAVNVSDRTIYTYMGKLLPKIANATYSSAGQLSPLMNDPLYETIGIGTRIFLGGGEGYISWNGTQHTAKVKRNKWGVPEGGAATLSLIGDLKKMSGKYLRAVSLVGYGASLAVGIGIPIPILDEKVLKRTTIKDSQISAPIVDYSYDYPNGTGKVLGKADYASLRSGSIMVKGKDVPTGAISSYYKAREIADELRNRIKKKKFYLSEAVQKLPSNTVFKPIKQRGGSK